MSGLHLDLTTGDLGLNLHKHDNRYSMPFRNTCYVSPSYTDNDDSRRYSTIGAAITYAQSQTPTANSPWLIYIGPGEYTEQLTYNDYIYFQGVNPEVVKIKNTGRIIDITDEFTGFKNIWFEATGTDEILRINAGSDMANAIRFFECTFQGAGSANNVVNLNAYAEASFIGCSFINTSSALNIITIGNQANNTANIYQSVFVGSIVQNGGTVYMRQSNVIGQATMNNAAAFTADNCTVTYPTGTAIFLNTTGSFFAHECEITAAGLFMATNYRAVDITAQPTLGLVTNCDFLYAIAAPDYLLYSSVAFQFYGSGNTYQVGINSNMTNLATKERRVASTIAEYNAIQTAIDASTAGDIVVVDTGTYTEQVTLKSGVGLKGADKTQTIVQQAADPLTLASGYTGSRVENITFHVTTAENRVFDITEGTFTFENVEFTNGYLAADNQVANISAQFIECKFYKITITDSNGTPAFALTLRRCEITNAIVASVLKGDFWMYDTGFTTMRYTADTGSSGVYVIRCSANSLGGPIIQLNVANSGTYTFFRIINSELGSFFGTIVQLNCGQSTLDSEIVDNTMLAVLGAYDIEITAGYSITSIVCALNTMSKGIGGAGTFVFANPVKQVGGNYDFYTDIPAAFRGITANDQIVLLNKDVTITTALTPPSYAIKIDGNHQYNITRAAGSPIMTLGDSDDITFTNIDLIGSLDVAGNGTRLKLQDHTHLDGMIDIQSGDASTEIIVDQSEIEADATDQYAIRIADADPTITVKRSYLKGNGANPAIYWDSGVTNNNVDIGWSTAMYGNLGATSPFGVNAAQTPTVSSHHNIYNADPFAATFTNDITNPYDTNDPQGDF